MRTAICNDRSAAMFQIRGKLSTAVRWRLAQQAMKKRRKKTRNTKATKRVGELLIGVLDSFGWYGIGPNEPNEPQEKENEAEPDDQSEESETEAQYYFNPEDVQIAVDEAISNLITEGLIDEFKNPKEAPSLTSIFGALFGKNSELAQKADYFEDLISGYDDLAHIDDLKEAYDLLQSIVKEIEPEGKDVE